MNSKLWRRSVLSAVLALAASAPAADLAQKPGAGKDLIIDLGGGVKMEFVLIPPGTFAMGSARSPLTNEKPAHLVTISKPFYLGKYEVTQEQWEAVMSNTPSLYKGPNYPDSAKRPVENVSWQYCQVFLSRLKQKTGGFDFRLPTEAEWEYACRAGTTNEYSFGAAPDGLEKHAWYSANADGQTHPVGTKAPNAWGLYDMHGNVWEWCGDALGAYSNAPATDPAGPVSGGSRVLRGGAWNSMPDRLRSAYRHDLEPDELYSYYGFRCVAVAAAP